jgi:hypothetical protein
MGFGGKASAQRSTDLMVTGMVTTAPGQSIRFNQVSDLSL